MVFLPILYGINPLQLGCLLINNIIKSVEDYLNGNSTLKADLKFAHSQTLQFLATTLVSILKKYFKFIT